MNNQDIYTKEEETCTNKEWLLKKKERKNVGQMVKNHYGWISSND